MTEMNEIIQDIDAAFIFCSTQGERHHMHIIPLLRPPNHFQLQTAVDEDYIEEQEGSNVAMSSHRQLTTSE